MARAAKSESLRYADRYLGISASERRLSQELGVDPYAAEDVLVAGVKHLAKIDAAANLGLQDPAIPQGYGLTPAEIRRFHSMLLQSPTRQLVLEECARALDGVDGRDELFRHAMSLTSDDEVEVFLAIARLLARLHARRPVSRVLPGLRLPAAVARRAKRPGIVASRGCFPDGAHWRPLWHHRVMKFNCAKCPGYCCSHPRIAVSDFDIKRLAKHAGISERRARQQFTYRYKSGDIDERILRHHKDTVYKTVCRFFDRESRKCTVYEARPNVCRKYPYGDRCGYYDFLKFERAHQDDQEFIPTT